MKRVALRAPDRPEVGVLFKKLIYIFFILYSQNNKVFKMGKNFQGGNKQKSFANKHASNEHNCRFVQDPDEKYAIVTKVIGGGSFNVTYIHIDDDQNVLTKQSLAHIRGSMKGAKKRNNFVALHSFILIGLRQFETNSKNSDILHVYSNSDFIHLLDSFPHLQHLQQLPPC